MRHDAAVPANFHVNKNVTSLQKEKKMLCVIVRSVTRLTTNRIPRLPLTCLTSLQTSPGA